MNLQLCDNYQNLVCWLTYGPSHEKTSLCGVGKNSPCASISVYIFSNSGSSGILGSEEEQNKA